MVGEGYSIFHETMVDLSWPQVERAARDGAIVILPVGVIEEHGPHMSLGVDTYGAYLLARLARRELESRGVKTLIAPPFYWGINNATGSFPGSFTVRRETMKAVLWDIFASLNRWGLNRVFVVNHHGEQDHNLAILEAIKDARLDIGVRAYFVLDEMAAKRLGLNGLEGYAIVQKRLPSSQPPPEFIDIHAGGSETSMMLAHFPNLVDAELAKTLPSTDLTVADLRVWREGWGDAQKVTPLGYFGAPANSSAEAGRRSSESSAKRLADSIESFVKGTYKPAKL